MHFAKSYNRTLLEQRLRLENVRAFYRAGALVNQKSHSPGYLLRGWCGRANRITPLNQPHSPGQPPLVGNNSPTSSGHMLVFCGHHRLGAVVSKYGPDALESGSLYPRPSIEEAAWRKLS